MNVLVDTCVWSKVLRTDAPDLELSALLKDLIVDNRTVLIGPIYQEILSGVRNKHDFKVLAEMLSSFDQLMLTMEIYKKAAENYNTCKSKGINGSHVDFLICAVAQHYNCGLFTIDSDFNLFAKHLSFTLFHKK